MTILRWVAHIVFIGALVMWLGMALSPSAAGPETWAHARKRTGLFVVLVGAGVASIALAPRKGSRDEEETF